MPGAACQGDLHDQQQDDGEQERQAQFAAAFQREQRHQHQHQSGAYGGQIDLPMLLPWQARLLQQPRDDHPHGDLHGVQNAYARVEAQQRAITQDGTPADGGMRLLAEGRGGHG